MNTHTPGPWQWVRRQFNNSKTIELIHPQNGWLIVMDFVRLGMHGRHHGSRSRTGYRQPP